MATQLSTRFSELDHLLDRLSGNIRWAVNKVVLTSGCFSTTEANVQSVAHSRVHALIAKTGFDLGYDVEVESAFRPWAGRSFRTDIQLWHSQELIFLIEYESTNSSDSRLLTKDIDHYIKSLGNPLGESFPKYWLVIYTLPSGAVARQDWHSWDYAKSDPQHANLIANPHAFYKRILVAPQKHGGLELSSYPDIDQLTTGANWTQRPLFLVNLTTSGLEIDFPTSLSKRY